MSAYKIWECQICNWVYDEEKGAPDEGLSPGTRWEDVPDDWCCPECGVGKDEFEMIEVKQAETDAVNSQSAAAQADVAAIDTMTNSDPADSAAQRKPVIVIGSGLAGYTLVKEIRRQDKDMPIVMYTSDDGALYSKPALSTGFSSGKTAADLVTDSAESLAKKLAVEINIFTRISEIDTQNKVITLETGGTREYSKLVLATGANCIVPPLQGDAISKVHKVNDLLDYAKFRTLINTHSHVLILGAGLIGSEYADDLTRAGYRVTVVDPLQGLLATLLPPEASKALTQGLEAAGVTTHFGAVVERLDHCENRVKATLSNGTEILADQVLSAVGVRPNTALAQQAGIRCARGIEVGRSLQTSAPDVFAVGDCAQVDGKVLVYIAPLNAQVKALAKTLCGTPTEVTYGVMPIAVKTKLHAVTVNPPCNNDGSWVVDVAQPTGVKARFVSATGALQGYALTGDQCREAAKLMRQCPPLLPPTL